jgi:tRNA-dihydrouridine synthase
MLGAIGFLTGPLGKITGIAFAFLVSAGGLLFMVHTYNAMVVAQHTVSEQRADAEQMQSDHNRIVAGFAAVNAAQARRAAKFAAIMGDINAAPASNCPVPASIRAVMDGLRSASPNGASAAPHHP